MADGYFHRLHRETPTRLWINNPTLEEAEQSIAAGAVSCTTNPAYAARIIKLEPIRASRDIHDVIHECTDDRRAADMVQKRIVKPIMDKFLDLYERAPGQQGFVSIQGDPYADDDHDHIVEEALQFRKLSKNFITKIPCTSAGLKAFEQLIPEDMPIIATEVFAMAQVTEVCELYERVSRQCGKHPPFYVTHISGIFDEWLTKIAERESIEISPEVLAQAGCTVARKQYAYMRNRGYDITLLGGGARGTYHFTELVGGALHVTINWSTAEEIIQMDPPVASRIGASTPQAIIDELCGKLADFKMAYNDDGLAIEEFADFAPLRYFRNMFVKGWDTLLENIQAQREKRVATV